MVSFQINGQDEIGTRLDHFLVSKTNAFSRSKIQSWIKSGHIKVNNNICKTGYLLEEDDMVVMNIPTIESSEIKLIPENQELDIIFEDEYLVAVNKPAGMIVHPGIGARKNTLVNGLLYHFKDLSNINGTTRPGIVHRLDKETSGIILIAKTNEAHSYLANQFKERKINKKYVGLTWGIWKNRKGKINEPISRSKKDPRNYQVSDTGKKSITNYEVKKIYRHLSLISFIPKTGRTHQIRVHSSYQGHPIFGDKKYGGRYSKARGYLPEFELIYRSMLDKFNRHALHASKIEFKHPNSKNNVILSAPLPKEYLNLINTFDSLSYE